MWEKCKKYIEPNKALRTGWLILIALLLAGSLVSFCIGEREIHADYGELTFANSESLHKQPDTAEPEEDSSVYTVTYENGEDQLNVDYAPEDYPDQIKESVTGYVYQTSSGTRLVFDHENPSIIEVNHLWQGIQADRSTTVFNLAVALLMLFFAFGIMLVFSQAFTTYEKCWFLSIMVLATVVDILFPEEDANGVNRIVIMMLYLLDTFLNILCELLISKQSRYNFLVSLGVEVTEIVTCLILRYRFATMATTLLFWIPIDILSYINWTRHKDQQENELTSVRRLKGWQEVLVIAGIVVWTLVFGYLISGLNIQTDFYNDKALETAVIYIDACASAVGVANGLFILFRLREQWIAWYICAALEAVINIMSGQYVLLVLKLGYFTNTTYGYIKWSKYINQHQNEKKSLF